MYTIKTEEQAEMIGNAILDALCNSSEEIHDLRLEKRDIENKNYIMSNAEKEAKLKALSEEIESKLELRMKYQGLRVNILDSFSR